MVHPEGYGGHGHAVTADHPVLMREYVFLFDRLQSFHRAVKPIHRHEHEEYPFPKTSLGKKTHVQTGGRTKYKYNQYIYLPHPDMDLLSFFKDVRRELSKRRDYTKHTRENVNVETVFINGF